MEYYHGTTTTQQNGANITVTWDTSGPYELSVTQTNTIGANCVSDPFMMTINPIPTVIITGNSDACVDEQGSYTATSIDNVDYNWTIIPASAGTLTGEVTSANPEVLWHEAGTATLELSVCGQTETIQVVVHGKPEPTVLFPGSLCANEVTTISTTTTFDSYQWINESGITVSNDPTPDLGPGYYELVVTNNFGCMEDTTFFIDPLPTPKVRISSPTPIWFCPGGTFPTLYAVDTDSGYDFEWFQDGVPVGTNAPTFTTTAFGSYRVQVTDQNGCQNLSNILNVIDICNQPPPDTLVSSGCTFSTLPSFVKDYPAPLCDEHSYTSTTTGHIPGTLRWSFDDNTGNQSGAAVTHRFNEAGFYRVRHYAQFNDPLNPGQVLSCGITRIDTILISAAFDSDLACPGGTTQFTDISTFLPITSISSWSWDFGDPTSGADNTSSDINPTHVFSDVGNYDVTLTITDPSGCVSVRVKTITVHPRPDMDFAEPTIQCEATAMEFNLNVLSGFITSVNWDFGDPSSGEANTSTLENTFHEFANPGNYDVTLFATNIYGCTNSYVRTITVEPNLLNGDISLSQPSPLCEGESTVLTAPSGGINWLWSNGETTESITVNTEDVYAVTITDNQGCSYAPAEVAIDIIPAPAGTIRALEYDEYGQLQDYLYDNPLELCEGEDLFLEIIAEGNNSYSWSTGSALTILEYSEERGNLLSAGTYDYTVVITDNTTGCTVEAGPTQVIVHGLPAAFTISAVGGGPVCAGSNTLFRVDSPNPALTYRWSNGEVGESIFVSEGGTYSVTAINSFGCETESNELTVRKGPNVSLAPAGCHTRCTPDTICVPPVPNVSNYQWYFDGSPIAGATSREYIAMNSGFYQLEMTDNQGCTLLSDGLTLTLSTGFGHIRGFVYDDVNQNMIIDAGDSLLTNVTVNLLEAGTVVATRISNQNAEYVFENTPSGTYTVQVDTSTLPPNYTPIIEDVDVTITGCDVDEIISLLVQETQCATFASTLTLNTCNGVVVPYEGELLSPGITPVTLTAMNGCDSTVTVTVIDNSSYQMNENYAACVGTDYDYFGTIIPAGSSAPVTFTSAAGCDSIVTVTIAEVQTITTTENYAACTGTNYDYYGTSIPAGSSAPVTFTSTAGCDSIVTVTIAEVQTITTTENYAACTGTNYDYYGTSIPAGSSAPVTFTSAAGCDSIVTVMVAEVQTITMTENYAACTGTNYDYFGTIIPAGSSAPVTFTSAAGCDSIVTVMVAEVQTITMTENYAACTGTNYDYYGTSIPAGSSAPITFTSAAGCDSIVTVMVAEVQTITMTENYAACTGTNYDYYGTSIPAGSSAPVTFTSAAGCDSIVTVTIAAVQPITTTENYAACTGTNYDYYGTSIPAGSSAPVTFTSAAGCDSIVTVTIAEVQTITTTENYAACTGTNYDYYGTSIPAGSSAPITFTSAAGCDSIVTVMVAEVQTITMTENYAACTGTNYDYYGTSIPAGSSAPVTFTSAAGCDSIVTVMVAEVQTITTTENYAACTGTNYDYYGTSIPAGSSAPVTFTSAAGCDSIVTVIVAEVQTITTTENYAACTGTNYDYYGTSIPAGSSAPITFTSTAGCDSIVTVTIAEVQTITTTENYAACSGTNYDYYGTSIPAGSSAPVTFTSAAGCDSIVTVMVAEVQTITTTENYAACTGTNYDYYGTSIPAGSSAPVTFTSAAGCDSIVTVTIAEVQTITTTENYAACTGTNYDYYGTSIPAGSSAPVTFTSTAGCDSIVTVTIAEVQTITTTENYAACTGTNYDYYGTSIPAGSSAPVTFTSAAGCDSIVTVMVAEVQTITMTENYAACTGTNYDYYGTSIPAGSSAPVTFTSAAGCDSIVTVMVAEVQTITMTENYAACTGTNYDYYGTSIPAGSSAPVTFTSAAGCDSIVTVIVAEVQTITTTENYAACSGTNYDYYGTSIPAGSSAPVTFTSAAGCDSIVTVTVAAYPEISYAIEATETCADANAGTIEIISGLGGGSYTFELVGSNTNQTEPLFESLAPGDYEVVISDANGCNEVEMITVPEIAPLSVELEDLVLACGDDAVRMVPEVSGDIRGLSYEWSDGSTDFYTEIGQTGPVSLTVNNICGSQTVTAIVSAEKDDRDNWLFIPNGFSPNGDNHNDIFNVVPVDNISVLEFEMRVISRWGSLVFQSGDINRGWSGYTNGKMISSGVYIYQIKATIESCGEIIKVDTYGDVTLLR